MKTRIIAKPDLLNAKIRTNSTVKHIDIDVSNFAMPISMEGKKYFIRTYGCQANVRDEETMRGLLESIGLVQVEHEKDADVIIINTCAVRENAEDKVYGEIGNLKALRLKNKELIIGVCGCMVEQPEILEKLLKTYPHINLIFGTHEIRNLLEYIKQILLTKERIVVVESKEGEVYEGISPCRNNKFKAFVNIMYGCNKFCSYCIVPYTRGKERSRTFESVLKECQELKNSGYKEITLLGQNVNAYGKDLDENKDFADLLEAVALTGIDRLRFTTSHPWDFSSKMLDVIAKYPNIMNNIHLPVQSGNDQILKLMGRRYDSKRYIDLVKEMKEKIPNLTLSTDIIVGFPNETLEQFNDTLKLVDIVKYDSAFTFIYSPRRGTPAAKMEDNVTYQEKVVRFKELVKHLEVTISESASKMIGNTYKVLVDGPSKTDKNMYSGYTECNRLVHFKGDETLVGQIVNVRILENKVYSLMGELVNG